MMLSLGRMRLCGAGHAELAADDELDTRPTIGEEDSALRLSTTEGRLKPRTPPDSQPRIGFTGASKEIRPPIFPRPSSGRFLFAHEAQSSSASTADGGLQRANAPQCREPKPEGGSGLGG